MIDTKKNKKTESNENSAVIYDIRVKRAKVVKENRISFTMDVNGVSISGCWYSQGEKDGKEYSFIDFPSYKGNDGRYYSYVYIPITDALKTEIERQIESLLG